MTCRPAVSMRCTALMSRVTISVSSSSFASPAFNELASATVHSAATANGPLAAFSVAAAGVLRGGRPRLVVRGPAPFLRLFMAMDYESHLLHAQYRLPRAAS